MKRASKKTNDLKRTGRETHAHGAIGKRRQTRDGLLHRRPDYDVVELRISFGTSGHRGSALSRSFNESHVLAITQAICLYRVQQGIAKHNLAGVKKTPFENTLRLTTTHRHDYLHAYVNDLGSVIDMDAIRGANLNMGAIP